MALFELNDILAFGTQTLSCLIDEPVCHTYQEWLGLLGACLQAAGGLNGADERAEVTIERHFSAQPYVYDGRPQRDERFQQ